MTFWIQHGYGKADKIDRVANTGLLKGVILSPADEGAEALETTAMRSRLYGIEVLMDPQLYVHTLEGASARCHESNGLEFGNVIWYSAPHEISTHVSAVVDANDRLRTEQIIAPTPYQASFGDSWTPLSLQYAQATLALTDRPVYVSVVAEEAAFSDWYTTSQYLDALTTLEATGVYLIVGTASRSYPHSWDPRWLANILRTIYVLTELNRYEVLWGYSDLAGMLGLAVGSSGAATGWYNSLRMWTTEKWMPKSGGRQATPRVFVEPLLSPVERVGEGASMARTRHRSRVFPDPDERRSIRNDEPWTIADSWNQHLAAMAQLYQTVNRESSVSERIINLRKQLEDAIELLSSVEDAGATVSPAHTNRLRSFVTAIDTFADEEGL